MLTRREVLKKATQLTVVLGMSSSGLTVRADDRSDGGEVDGIQVDGIQGDGVEVNEVEGNGVEVNDVQSLLNATRVHRIERPKTIDAIQAILWQAKREGRSLSVAGGRHAMGGQQFGRDTVLVAMTQLSGVVKFDKAKGHIEVEAGIEWPELIEHLEREQAGESDSWGIREKQSGVDQVSLGGSLASNIHGRSLRFPPIIHDVESFVLLDAQGRLHKCSRNENAELFSLAIGGYGLFGVIVQVTLRLAPRTKVERVVDIIPVKDLLPAVEKRLQEGFTYGDCQYSTCLDGPATSHAGVFSCYRPVARTTPMENNSKPLSARDWIRLYSLARTDKKQAFKTYSEYYLTTSGQVYWSDTHQLSGDFGAYRQATDRKRGTEMITEVYVSKDRFLPFVAQVRQDLIDHNVDMTYGTIRFIEKDSESFLSWAKEPSVCIICNLHVTHTDAGKQKVADDFRRILDRVIQNGGRYYLTYHRFATRAQVEACYPQFVDFLRLKKKYDPQERLQSDWYRHYRTVFADRLG